MSPAPEYPFSAAYLQRAAVGDEEQEKLFPDVKLPKALPLTLASMSMAAEAHAELVAF